MSKLIKDLLFLLSLLGLYFSFPHLLHLYEVIYIFTNNLYINPKSGIDYYKNIVYKDYHQYIKFSTLEI